MEIVTFTTRGTDGWQPPRFGALVNSEYLLDFERTFYGGGGAPTFFVPLGLVGGWGSPGARAGWARLAPRNWCSATPPTTMSGGVIYYWGTVKGRGENPVIRLRRWDRKS